MTYRVGAASEVGPVLDSYDVGEVSHVEPAGGTAGRTWRVAAERGEYFLRRRGQRTSAEARLRFDHGLRDHLLGRGVATAASVPTRTGTRWVTRPEGVYELYPLIRGRLFDPHSRQDLAAAARALARYHLAAADYRPRGGPEPVAQYTAIGFSPRTSDRMDDPDLLRENLEAVAQLANTDAERAAVQRCIGRVEAMDGVYTGAAYERLTGWVLHGDYTPANLVWAATAHLPEEEAYQSLVAAGANDGDLVFIFDLDWALPGARCRDVADGLYFFGTRPRHLDASSIWSLTEAADFDVDRCTRFLSAYLAVSELADEELDALPTAFAGRWLSIRLEGMAKVQESERFRFFSRGGDVESPLAWLDTHWPEVSRRRCPGGCSPPCR